MAEEENGVKDFPDAFGLRGKQEVGKSRQRRLEEGDRPKDGLYEDIKPILVTLFILGILPITRTKTGVFRFKLVSLAMVYSVLLYLILWVCLGFSHYKEVRDLDPESVDHIVSMGRKILHESIILIFPFFYWVEAKGLAEYLNQWNRYQADYLAVTGQRLRPALMRRTVIVTVWLPIVFVTLNMLYSYEDGDFFPPLLLARVYRDLAKIFTTVFWHLMCHALISTSDNLIQIFKKEMSAAGSAERVTAYRLAWLRLSHLARGLGDAGCYTYGFYVSYLFLNLILSVYLAVTSLNKILFYHVDILDSLVTAACLYVFCDGSTQVLRHVGRTWKTHLLSLRTCSDLDGRRQLDEFLMTCSLHKPIMRLGDYVRVDRSLLASFASSMVTYLILVVQFKVWDMSNHAASNTTTTKVENFVPNLKTPAPTQRPVVTRPPVRPPVRPATRPPSNFTNRGG